jgi:hypothetical protein
VIRSTDQGETWSEPVWLDLPERFYQRSYAQAVALPDGTLLYPTYTTERFDGPLHGAIHRSTDGGCTWHLHSTIAREDGGTIDEPSLTCLASGRLMLMTRPDAAVFYSDDAGRSWRFSHHAPFAPLKAHRTAVLGDGTVVCWMTSHGTLRASWSVDDGRTWKIDTEGKPLSLDPHSYGYPGGCLLEDESIFAVYYDAANQQRRTSVWGLRFRISDDRNTLLQLPAPVMMHAGSNIASGDRPELDVDAMNPSEA